MTREEVKEIREKYIDPTDAKMELSMIIDHLGVEKVRFRKMSGQWGGHPTYTIIADYPVSLTKEQLEELFVADMDTPVNRASMLW